MCVLTYRAENFSDFDELTRFNFHAELFGCLIKTLLTNEITPPKMRGPPKQFDRCGATNYPVVRIAMKLASDQNRLRGLCTKSVGIRFVSGTSNSFLLTMLSPCYTFYVDIKGEKFWKFLLKIYHVTLLKYCYNCQV